MENKIYEITKGWAGYPTWFTGHPADLKRRLDMLERLYKEIGQSMDEIAFSTAIERLNRENVELPGGKPSEEQVNDLIFQALTDFRELGFTS